MTQRNDFNYHPPFGSWIESASCIGMDPDLFFSPKGHDIERAIAMNICRECPVRKPCLEFALDNNEHTGIWGGVSERGRRRLRKKKEELEASLANHRQGLVDVSSVWGTFWASQNEVWDE